METDTYYKSGLPQLPRIHFTTTTWMPRNLQVGLSGLPVFSNPASSNSELTPHLTVDQSYP